MLFIPPSIHRKRLPKPHRAGAAPAPTAIVLVAATYNEALWVRLSFDRAINIAAINPGQIMVKDGLADGQILVGTAGATLITPNMVEIPLEEVGPFSDDYTALYATAITGIRAVNDNGLWAGVSQAPLPFP